MSSSNMRTWVKMTKKRVRCRYCEKWIESGSYQVVCQYYMNTTSGKNWVKRMYFHAKNEDSTSCWVERAIQELKSRPSVETRGRKRSDISDVDRIEREKIMRRHGSAMQRLRNEMGGKYRLGVIEHLIEVMEGFKNEIEPYGGVPKGW